MTPPFGALRFLYVGTTDFDHDLAFYLDHHGRGARLAVCSFWRAGGGAAPG
ncbi:MAG: hypothetical protein IPO15_11265 [Anaerolineae bacterium]|uniref:hypothetical protein n=1 Tax=Candidatus Amarolinea dominans TaxID=3140696 RepID=UPI003136F171|nr:hypothetical protein [Anaerolineae bacterium]